MPAEQPEVPPPDPDRRRPQAPREFRPLSEGREAVSDWPLELVEKVNSALQLGVAQAVMRHEDPFDGSLARYVLDAVSDDVVLRTRIFTYVPPDDDDDR